MKTLTQDGNKILRLLAISCLFCLLTNFVHIRCYVLAADSSSAQGQADKKPPQKKGADMVVKVNGKIFTQGELDGQINTIVSSVKGRYPQDKLEMLKLNIRKKVIEDYITRTLLGLEADRQNITASDEEISAQISELEKKMPKGMTLEAALQHSGMSMEKLRDDIMFSLRVKKLLDSQLKGTTTPSNEEIKKYYESHQQEFNVPETVHARHILLKTDEKDNDKTKAEKLKKIEGIRKKLISGGDFAQLAKQFSECPSKERGGDLGTFPRGRMVKDFENAAFSQKVNEIGPVVKTQFGYHIIQVLAHNSAKSKPFDEVKGEIIAKIEQQKKQEMATSYIADLRKKADIVYGNAEDSQN